MAVTGRHAYRASGARRVLLTVAVSCLAVVGLAVSNRLIERERARTEEANTRLNTELGLAAQTLDEVYLRVGEWTPRDPRRRKEHLELLEKVLGFYEQFAAQRGADPQVRVTLATYHLKLANPISSELMLAAGRLVWQAGPIRDDPGLCHGTAGNAYALLALWRRTGDEQWLERARAFAQHAAAQVEARADRRGYGWHSLYSGDEGVAMCLASCISGDEHMPIVDRLI